MVFTVRNIVTGAMLFMILPAREKDKADQIAARASSSTVAPHPSEGALRRREGSNRQPRKNETGYQFITGIKQALTPPATYSADLRAAAPHETMNFYFKYAGNPKASVTASMSARRRPGASHGRITADGRGASGYVWRLPPELTSSSAFKARGIRAMSAAISLRRLRTSTLRAMLSARTLAKRRRARPSSSSSALMRFEPHAPAAALARRFSGRSQRRGNCERSHYAAHCVHHSIISMR